MKNYLNPDQHRSDFDSIWPEMAEVQFQKGLTIGQNSHTIYINRSSVWSSFDLTGLNSTHSHEVIGSHPNTASLLRGFLASDAAILVETAPAKYELIKQCVHPQIMDNAARITLFDYHHFSPQWRQITKRQFRPEDPPLLTFTREGDAICLEYKQEGGLYFARLQNNPKYEITSSPDDPATVRIPC